MNALVTVTGDVLIVVGALVFTTAALGVLRFPDAYTRLSAVGTAGGIGIIFVVSGALLHLPSVPNLVKVIVIIALQLITSAIGSIALARSTYLTRTPLHRPAYDELTSSATHGK
ncbi:multicomponent Na+:H+ antiporter subunit G [Tamaricihabitans halophyticus]|uniref:Multicomponent Na+:H+ antiporter subunit G n=1 Tax=Tamaricihabitans halophyticus TaxID=1262583 RepID=A0A4R2R0Q2_9PSEU|nr:monovalent cation/H(+) antiporter subunit G [Tamaricihabitans halophyticus]TCP52985.1 multicomponent Na+:H+ antiporter subunit G [Tamaricihabitans halophyticus]